GPEDHRRAADAEPGSGTAGWRSLVGPAEGYRRLDDPVAGGAVRAVPRCGERDSRLEHRYEHDQQQQQPGWAREGRGPGTQRLVVRRDAAVLRTRRYHGACAGPEVDPELRPERSGPAGRKRSA